MAELNFTIHQPVRLQIMASLVALETGAQLDFSSLGKLLKLTDGNLGAQLLKLEEAGYVALEKKFVLRKPMTLYRMTDQGREALTRYVRALRELLGSVLE